MPAQAQRILWPEDKGPARLLRHGVFHLVSSQPSAPLAPQTRWDLSKFLQVRPNALIFRYLPNWLTRRYLGLLGSLFFSLAADKRRPIQASLDHFQRFHAAWRDQDDLWAAVRAGIIDHYHEKLVMGFKPVPTMRKFLRGRVQIAGEELLRHALEQGRGAILVTGHFGAVEFMPGALAVRDYPVTAMVHCKSQALWESLLERAAGEKMELLDPKAGNVLFCALDNLKRGRVLITQCDEMDMWRPYRDRSLNFLGLNLGLDKVLDVLARKSKAPVLFGLMHRRPAGRYRMLLEKPQGHPAALEQKGVSAQCLSILEANIIASPESWYEWKKLQPYLDRRVLSNEPDHQRPVGLSDRVAVQVHSRA